MGLLFVGIDVIGGMRDAPHLDVPQAVTSKRPGR
jgi:hypothetical protein